MDGQSVTLGIRPEQLWLSPEGTHVGTVSLVEPMGNHQVVWLDSRGVSLSILLRENVHLVTGTEVRFDLNSEQLAVFDTEGGQKAMTYRVETPCTTRHWP